MKSTTEYNYLNDFSRTNRVSAPMHTSREAAGNWQRSILLQTWDVFQNDSVSGLVLSLDEPLSHTALQEITTLHSANHEVISIACSRFSRTIPFGALLFLLTDGQGGAQSTDFEIYRLLQKRFSSDEEGKRPVVVVENAGMLDTPSEQVLARLVSHKVIRLLAICKHVASLGFGFRGLLRQQILQTITPQSFSIDETEAYLRHRLGGTPSPFAIAHLHVLSGGDLAQLEPLINRLIDEGNLQRRHNAWVISFGEESVRNSRPTIAAALPENEHSRLLKRIVDQRILRIAEIADDRSSLAVLDSLIAERLVKYVGLGAVAIASGNRGEVSESFPDSASEPTDFGQIDLELVRISELVSKGCYIDAQKRLAVIGHHRALTKAGEDRLYGPEHCYIDALWSTHIALGNHAEARSLILAIDRPIADNIDYLDANYSVQLWYGEIASGGQPRLAAPMPLSGEWTDLVKDNRWRTEPMRLLGTLCIAYQWALEGEYANAQGLLNWAVGQLEGRSSRLDESPMKLVYPHLIFVACSVAMLLHSNQAWLRIDNVAKESFSADPLAYQYAAYFRALRSLSNNERGFCNDGQQAMITQMSAFGGEPGRQRSGLLQYALQRGLGDQQAQVIDLPFHADAEFTLGVWEARHLALILGSTSRETIPVAAASLALVRLAVSHGLIYCAQESLLLAIASGELDDNALEAVRIEFKSYLDKGRTGAFLDSVVMKNQKAEYELRTFFAGVGRAYMLSVGTQSALKSQPSLRRILQRANAKLRAESIGSGPIEIVGPNEHVSAGNNWATCLTPRERTIATYASRGLKNSDIARECGISVRTVEGHLYQIHSKLNLNSRRELRALAGSTSTGGLL